MVVLKLLLLFATFFLMSQPTLALYQPWIAEQAARKAYLEKLATYSQAAQEKTTALANLISAINKKRGEEMSNQINLQAQILDEYQRRHGDNESDPKIEKARYWLTYAHEAVAFQVAKNYIFSLISESNLRKDVTPTVTQFKADLVATKKKVLYSQQLISELVK